MFNPVFPGMDLQVGVRELVGATVIYVYIAYTSMVLAHRLHLRDAWMAWVPFANLYLLAKMANKSPWFALGFLLPYVNFFTTGYLWSGIAFRLGKNSLLGAAIILPVIGLFVPGYLVLSTDHRQHSREHRQPPGQT